MSWKEKLDCIKKDFDMNSVSSCVFHHSQWERCEKGEEHASLAYFVYRLLYMAFLVSSLMFSTLCQSYLFHIFLTNWSFTIQVLYSVLYVINIVWKKHPIILRKLRNKFLHSVGYTDSVTSYELRAKSVEKSEGVTEVIVQDGQSVSTILSVAAPGEDLLTKDEMDGATVSNKTEPGVSVMSNNNNSCALKVRNNDPPNPLEKVIWALMNVIHVLPHIVVLGYWGFVYKYDPKQPPCEAFRSHYILHGATAVLSWIDALVVAVPARKTHFVFPSTVIMLYCLFSYFYELGGGPYRDGNEFIYAILNWRYHPSKTTLIVVVGTIISPSMHVVTCWAIHLLRVALAERYKQSRK